MVALSIEKKRMLRAGTIAVSTMPFSTKNMASERNSERHLVNINNDRHFGMKSHVRAYKIICACHVVADTAPNIAGIAQCQLLLTCKEKEVVGQNNPIVIAAALRACS